jgi:hypothetical protein
VPAANWVPLGICGLAVSGVLLANAAGQNRSQEHLVDAYGRSVLALLPADAVLFVTGDNEIGPIGYLHLVEGLRPDIELREANNLVLANRLASPFAKSAELDQQLLNFASQSQRPIYTTTQLFAAVTRYGLVDRLNRNSLEAVGFAPESDIFLDYLLDLYAGNLLTDSHERQFLLYLLARYGKQYAMAFSSYLDAEGSAGSWPGLPVTQAHWHRFQRLQSTFPGARASLKQLLDSPDVESRRHAALALASQAEALQPEYASLQGISLLANLAGRAHLLAPVDRQAGERLLLHSVDIWPTAKNASICPLLESYQNSGKVDSAEELLARFPEVECP